MRILSGCCVIATALLVACGGCKDDPPGNNQPDGGSDVAQDSTTDSTFDMTADMSLCGNNALDPGEACDGDLFENDASCEALGLPAGSLTCSDTCEVDSTTCAVCDDGVCSDGETAASCAQDCGVKSIAAGRTHTCATLADGSLWCWGARDGHGMGGTPDTNIPMRVPGHDDVVEVTAGDHHTCFRNQANEVWCFGKNGFGEAGQDSGYHVFPPARVQNTGLFETASSIVAGRHHTCAINTTDSQVFCWGRGDYGQRGDGAIEMRNPVPTPIVADPDMMGATTVGLGEFLSCSIDNNFPFCWGDNRRGFFGSDRRHEPVPDNFFASPSIRATNVAVGSSHICINIERDDAPMFQMLCFGGNAYGQLGLEPSTDDLGGTFFTGLYEPVVAGFGYTCGQERDGATTNLLCWGDNYYGQLGDGTVDDHHLPADVTGLDEVIALAGGHDHVCAILPDETARCWGRNGEGQLGNGSEEPRHSEPVVPVGLGEGGAQ